MEMNTSLSNKINWCINKHKETNHFYDEYLPYEFHLRMVVGCFYQFKHLILKFYISTDTLHFSFGKDDAINIRMLKQDVLNTIELSCWGHDLQEDTRTNYNEIKHKLGELEAEIIRSVTNYGRGRDRNERMPNFVYEDIRNTPFATFVKLCDRIANAQYSKMTKSDMFKKYHSENEDFLSKLQIDKNIENHDYTEMVEYLRNIFKS